MPYIFSLDTKVKELNEGEIEEQYLHWYRLHDILWDSPDALERAFDM